MSPKISKMLRVYAVECIPKVAREKYPEMPTQLYGWLKRWWNEMDAKERTEFRRIAERLGPLPDRFKRVARSHKLIVQWPPPKPEPKKRVDRKRKPKQRRIVAGGPHGRERDGQRRDG